MHDQQKRLEQLVAKNLPQEFVQGLEDELRWGAEKAWRDVMEPRGIGSPPVSLEEKQCELDRMARNRRLLGNSALLAVAKRNQVPFEYRHIGGGHYATFVQFGELVLGIEAVSFVSKLPAKAGFRCSLASGHHHALLQLELPLGDKKVNRLDPRDTTYCIVQHCVPLTTLAKIDCDLRSLALMIPNAELDERLLFADILGQGYWRRFVAPNEAESQTRRQVDAVKTPLRARKKARRTSNNGD